MSARKLISKCFLDKESLKDLKIVLHNFELDMFLKWFKILCGTSTLKVVTELRVVRGEEDKDKARIKEEDKDLWFLENDTIESLLDWLNFQTYYYTIDFLFSKKHIFFLLNWMNFEWIHFYDKFNDKFTLMFSEHKIKNRKYIKRLVKMKSENEIFENIYL